MGTSIPVVARAVAAADATVSASIIPTDVVFVGWDGMPVDVINPAKAAKVAKAAGASPTKAEFDALIDSLTSAGILAAV
ncbi:MAG: hypothetical protein RR842_08160 [Gordonibacter sp.]|uniref:hypothetical protein n=1 Tax=Gordonibacter sp. TaxID=1968902 RepID=UPI002FCB2E2E